jgi:WD40-like Beta Propeller Repeat.
MLKTRKEASVICLLLLLMYLPLTSIVILSQNAQGSIFFIAPNQYNGKSIYIANPDGTNPHQIPVPLVNVETMEVSYDGNVIVAWGQTANDLKNGVYNIYAFDPQGNNFIPLTNVNPNNPQGYKGYNEYSGFPTISGNGRYVAYELVAYSQAGLLTTYWVADLTDPYNPIYIGSTDTVSLGLALTPDGRYLIGSGTCTSNCPMNPAYPYLPVQVLYIAPVTQGGINQARQLTTTVNEAPQQSLEYMVEDEAPSVSPDGTKVAFIRFAVNELQTDLYSPIGYYIYWTEIYVLDLNTGNLYKVVSPQQLNFQGYQGGGEIIDQVSWTPDGNNLVFSILNRGVYEVNLQTGAIEPIIQGNAQYAYLTSINYQTVPSSNQSSALQGSFTPYVDNSSPYWSVNYPSSWTVVDASKPPNLNEVIFSNKNQTLFFVVYWSQVSSSNTLRGEFESRLKQSFGSYNIINTSTTTISNTPVKVVVYNLTVSTNSSSLKANVIFVSYYFDYQGYGFELVDAVVYNDFQTLQLGLSLLNIVYKSFSLPSQVPSTSTTSQGSSMTKINSSSSQGSNQGSSGNSQGGMRFNLSFNNVLVIAIIAVGVIIGSIIFILLVRR